METIAFIFLIAAIAIAVLSFWRIGRLTLRIMELETENAFHRSVAAMNAASSGTTYVAGIVTKDKN